MRYLIKYRLFLLCLIGVASSFAQIDNLQIRRQAAEKIAKENNLNGTEYNSFIESYVSLTKEQDSQSQSDFENKISAACGASSGINIGFELNNYSDWVFWGGTNLRSITDSVGFSLTAGTKTLISGGVDPVSSISLTSPLGGLRVIKLNDNITNAQISAMKTKFKVTPATSLLKTATSLVFQTAGHECKDNPYIKIQILNCDESIIYHEYYSLRTDGYCTGINQFAFTGSFTPWHVLCFDLLPYIGQTVVLKVSVGDCVFTGHYGYGYFDATLSPSSGYPLSNTINVNGTNYPFNSNFNSVCLNNSISVTAPSGASTYSWTGPYSNAATQTFTNAFDGYYSIAMTSTNGCTYEKHYLLNLTPTVSIVAGTTTLCPGATYSMAGTGAIYYNWMPLSLTSSTVYPSSFSSLTHTLTGYNLNKVCSGTATRPITIYSTPTITTSGNASVCIGNSITLTANGASSYTWSTGANTSSIVVSPTVNAFYSVWGASSVGCNLSGQSLSVQAVPTNTNVIATSQYTSICLGDSVRLTASFGQGAYLWNTGATTYTTYVKPTNTTVYSVSIGSACPVTRTVQVVVNTPTGGPLTVTSPASVCPSTNFTVSSTGYSSYSYKFGTTTYNGNPITANVSSAITNFTVTATDVGGCITSSVVPIFVYTSSLTYTNPGVICAGQSATLVASGANTYTWTNNVFVALTSNDTLIVSPVSSTYYYLYGTDINGCRFSGGGPINLNVDPNSLTISSSSNSTCVGGTVNLFSTNFSAPTTYSWSTGATTRTTNITPTITTIYSVTANNSVCGSMSASTTITVSPFNTPTISISASGNTICIGSSATLTANGANSYTWSSGQGVPTIAASSSFTGTLYYWVTGTDINGCKSTSPTFTISNFSNPTVTINGLNSICPGGSTTFTANGASTYSWSTGSTSNPVVLSPLSNMAYTVTGYNSSGCKATATRTITVLSLPTLTLSTGSPSVCPGGISLLNASSFNGNTFSWSNGSVYDTAYVKPLITTAYTCTIQGYNGCSYSNSITVNVTPLPAVTLGVSSNTFCPFSSALLILSPSPSGGFYTPSGITNTLTLNAPGTYTIGYQVNSPCINKTTQTIAVFPAQCAVLSAAPDTMCVGQSSLLTYTPSGGTLSGPFISGSVFTPTTAGTYSVNYNYVDAYGCNYSDCESLLVNICTTINELGLESVSVYPNPFTNEFIINNPNNLELSITVYDLNGKFIQKYTSDKTSKLNAENYSDGIYYLHISSKEFSKFVKLIKL